MVTPALDGRPSGPLPPVRIAIAYRDPQVRSALRAVLEQVPGCRIVADSADATEVAEQIRRHPSDLRLIDVRAPQIAGMTDLLETARQKSSQDGEPPTPPGRDRQERPPGNASLAGRPGGRSLTPRERQILGLIARWTQRLVAPNDVPP